MSTISENVTTIDARGLSCPQPVLETKRALDKAPAGDGRKFTVLVDTATSRENVIRFAVNAGWRAKAQAEGDHFKVEIER